ncbi:RagB/SusD family nutrient uptake outer membrane protein [Flavitalea flava]
MKALYKQSLIIFFCLSVFSCTKFVQVTPPAEQVPTTQLFEDSATAIQVLNGIYINLGGDGVVNYNLSIYLGLYADELDVTAGALEDEQFHQSALLSDNNNVESFWYNCYKYIYQANICIENAATTTALSEITRTQLTGESKFIRALSHFELVRLFGDIPLILTSDYRVNAVMARTPQAKVMEQIIADLLDAKSLLGSDYPGAENVRANKWAASALLARVYLYQKDWVNAEKEAAGVILSGKYTMESDLQHIFLRNNSEAIWQIMPADGYAMYEGYYFIPGSQGTLPNYPLTTGLINAFEPGDLRRQAWVDSTLVNGQFYYYPYKYKTTGLAPSTEYYTILRLTEQYLIRAEACAEQNKLLDGAQDLNLIRGRAGLSPVVTNDQASLLEAIYRERRIELFAENGQRWFDLLRIGRADSVLRQLKPQTWKLTGIVFPIPLPEIKSNPFLSQNPAY